MAGRGLLKYHIVGTLWVGQSSIVYRATDVRNQIVAIKMLLPETAAQRSAVRMMQREAELSLSFDHPNIIQAIEFIREGPAPALVMEHFDSDNLKTHIQRGEDFIHEHAHRIIVQICSALGYVHQRGLVHRDVKPENVLVAKDGTTKILDFALAEPIGKRRVLGLVLPAIAGTRPYIAPETIRRKPPDARTDIYSLGITIYEMLTGRPPFISTDRDELLRMHLSQQPTGMRHFRRTISARMNELVMEMLAKRPADRPESTDEVLRQMADIQVFDK